MDNLKAQIYALECKKNECVKYSPSGYGLRNKIRKLNKEKGEIEHIRNKM